LRPAGYDAEVVFLLAVLQNLGRLLLAYHFPDDAQQIEHLMAAPAVTGDSTAQPGMTEQAAAYAVLGCDIEALAGAAARQWGLTEEVLVMIRKLPTERPVRLTEQDGDVLRATACAANEIVDVVSQAGRADLMAGLQRVSQRYGRLLGVQLRDLGEALNQARRAQRHGSAVIDDDADDTPMPAPRSGPVDAGDASPTAVPRP
jgi:non-specific serine/threonine protein kinase